MYLPTDNELLHIEEMDTFHMMLCMGHDIDANGAAYLECQDTDDVGFGDDGFVRIARDHRLFRELVVMLL